MQIKLIESKSRTLISEAVYKCALRVLATISIHLVQRSLFQPRPTPPHFANKGSCFDIITTRANIILVERNNLAH
jgi:hypothetical protein